MNTYFIIWKVDNMDEIRIKARAKINLSIDIKGILENGYHDVEMVMQSIDLYDRLIIRKMCDGFTISSSSSDIPLDKRNIVYKTWNLMKERFLIDGGIDIFLEKNIPIAAGMAGGSSDSAAVILGINELYNLGLSLDEMKHISYELGSDIAFCFEGGTQLATGRGIDLKKLPDFNTNLRLLVCKPNAFISTKKVYKRYDSYIESKKYIKKPDNRGIIEGLENRDFKKIFSCMSNVLEPVTRSWCRDISYIEHIMRKNNAVHTMMTGSGPTVYGFFEDYNDIKKCSSFLRRKYKQTFITSISNIGVEIYGNRKLNNK